MTGALAHWAAVCDAFSDRIYWSTGEDMIDVYRQTLILGGLHVDSSKLTAGLRAEIEIFEVRTRILGFLGMPAALYTFLPAKVIFSTPIFPICISCLFLAGGDSWLGKDWEASLEGSLLGDG
jgi:hypothetical protein